MKAAWLVIAMVVAFVGVDSSVAFAANSDPIARCERLEAKKALHAKQLKKASKNKKPRVQASLRLQLKAATRAYARACIIPVCGDKQAATCAAAGGDMCIQVVVPQTYSSVAELKAAGATFLSAGECPEAVVF